MESRYNHEYVVEHVKNMGKKVRHSSKGSKARDHKTEAEISAKSMTPAASSDSSLPATNIFSILHDSENPPVQVVS
jgi:hypothetical protein